MSRFGGNREPRSKLVVGLGLLVTILLVSTGNLISQSSPISSNPTGPSGKPWKDNPYGTKVTRWPEQSPIRPITYAQWSAKQTASATPFTSTLVETRLSDNPAKSQSAVCVIINGGIYPGLEETIGGYVTDLARDGYTVELHAVTGGTAQDLRSFLAARHAAGIDGAVLIGDFPVAWYKTYCWDPLEEEQFPCDLYYMDLDGIWTDTDSDGIFETHTGTVAPDIWLGRLTASPLNMTGQTESQLLQNYFIKNHLYRTGSLPVNDQALVYVDDDWSSGAEWESEIVGFTYPDRVLVADDNTTVAADYAQRLRQYYELVEIWVHSDPLTHYFKIPPDAWHTTLGVGEMVTLDPPGVFYNLFACSNARYVETNYMGGWYIFRPSAGLAAIGSAKTGSMLDFDRFYQPLGSGRNIGEAFFDWFTYVMQYGVDDWEYCWFYGMTLCGDPTLVPHLSSCPRITEKSESDAAFGDGDGFYEPGETIECRVTVVNNGAKPARGVSVSLSADDASLEIAPVEILLGDIPHGGTADNNAAPFLVEIPVDYVGRTDSFHLDLTWNDGAGHDRLSFTLAVGEIPILLVDDDAGGNREKYYTEYLNKQRIPYRLWTSPPAPTADDLNQYDIVIWYTGDYRAAPLDVTKVAAIEGYLDDGGQLLLTGQGIAAQLSGLNPEFLGNYLKAQYLSTKYIPILAAMSGATLFTLADTAVIGGYGGAANQTKPDQIAAVNGGIPELQYYGDPGSGCVTWWDSYKLVFMSFGFEAMTNGDSRWVYRDTAYERILDQFQCSRPSSPMTISVTPGEAMNLVDHFPTIAWTYTDGWTHSQQMYQIQVGTDNDWNVAEMWDSGPVTSPDTASQYAGGPLVDGQRYFIRVQVFDGAVWSHWHYRQMRMNSRPGQPSNLNPDDLAEIPNNALDLTHDRIYDPDGEMVTYTYEVYNDPGMTQLAATASNIPGGTGTTVLWRIPGSLTVGGHYYWQVRSDDDHELSDWSAPASFTVAGSFMCGDANGDGKITVGDAVFIISYIFRGGPAPSPLAAADANGDGKINSGDAVYIVSYIFRAGPAPVCP